MVARNFLEVDANILYPRIDMSGDDSDIVASEFPFFNWLIFLIARIFGYQHWYGRLINLVISSIGVYCFFLLVKKYFDARIGFFAGLVLLSSIWFSFSRKIMPDTFSVSLVITGLFFLSRYLSGGTWFNILMFLIFSSLGGLSKIPSSVIIALAVIPLLDKNTGIKRKVIIASALMISIFTIVLWYFYWVPYLLNTYHNQLYFPKGFIQGIKELLGLWNWTLDRFSFVALHSYIALLFFIIGFYYIVKNSEKLILLIFIITFPVFMFLMIKAGNVFSTHDYYIIPFVPVMALICGYGLASIKKINVVYIIVGMIIIEGLANQHHDFSLKKSELYKVNLEIISDKICHKDEKIAINGGGNPEELYYSHRKGWSLNNDEIISPTFVNRLKTHGCKYLFLDRHSSDKMMNYKIVYKDDDYIIYKL